MARSQFHGQEEEEGCQEGCQEEEGPRLSHPLKGCRGSAPRVQSHASSTRRNLVSPRMLRPGNPMRGVPRFVPDEPSFIVRIAFRLGGT
jgi:hypothetical protein